MKVKKSLVGAAGSAFLIIASTAMAQQPRHPRRTLA